MKRGWCPNLYTPMQTGDGLLVRVKPLHARLTPEQARIVARSAAQYGNAVIELTQRGNLQIRGLRPDTTAPFAAAMVEAALAHPDPAHEARRHVIPPTLLGDDPTLAPNAAHLTATLEHAFQTHPDLASLPAKFALAVAAGGILASRPIAADLLASTDGQTTTLGPATRGASPAPVGLFPYPGTADAAFGCAPPFAQLDAQMLHGLADIAEHHGTTLHVTPWRALLLGRIPQDTTPAVPDSWITHPEDPRLRITACIGAPGCASATVPTRAYAARLRPTQETHVSGCAKGCAHPGPAPVTYVGHEGRYHLIHNGRASDPLPAVRPMQQTAP